MTHLVVRPAGSEDADAVASVLQASYPVLMAGAYDPDLLARALPPMTRPQPRLLGGGTYYLCDVQGQPVGCGGWSFEEPGAAVMEPGLAHIRHFATHGDWTGRGVGRALYQRCEADARAAGAHEFHCFSSLNGEAFYAALGFVRVAAIEVPMGDLRFPSILMRRGL